jgi:SAM-dependent methyltransferase
MYYFFLKRTMPFSTNYFKEETKKFIEKNFEKEIKILDIGAGAGTYSNLLKPLGYKNLDCVEVFEEYVDKFSLRQKYDKVLIGDITKLKIDFKKYDLIILGDVLEHIDKLSAIKLINRIKGVPTIIGVPFESEQGESFGNIHETHLQPDLTLENFVERFEGFHPICLRFDYGIFYNRIPEEIYFEVGQTQIPNNFLKFIVNNYTDANYIYLNQQPKVEVSKPKNDNKVTIVTGLWDLGRGKISDSFKRGYEDYKEKFSQLLKTDVNMYIFCDPSDEEFIWSHRSKENTVVNKMTLNDLREWFNFTKLTDEIRQKEEWLSQASWLRESPQATLEGYNPLVMSKMFMLNNVTIWNPFNSEYFFWIDAGISNTVHYGYFTHDKVFDKLPSFINENGDFVFLTYPYEGGGEIHGFERSAIAKYAETEYVKFVCRGGFFGGKKSRINEINGLYYGYLSSSLNEGYMGTEESIFSILLYKHSDLIVQYNIKGDGLIWPFFEDLKNEKYKDNVQIKVHEGKLDLSKVGLYVITFNSTNQFETLINSMLEYDDDFIRKPKKFLLNNSTDLSTTEKYIELCEKHGFEHIKKDNLGITGGRQWIADHFDKTDLDFMYFFEDDMFFHLKKGETCRNGFNRYVTNLYQKTLEIVEKEKFDFLKLNFSEFFGDNSIQWSWYNVPQVFRESHWPKNQKLPKMGLDPNAPRTQFNEIKSHKGVPYASGEIYLCNWPILLTKKGSYKCYLETVYASPFEQTLMSHNYQETIKGNLNPAILLMTPTEHNRFEHYDSSLRKEC